MGRARLFAWRAAQPEWFRGAYLDGVLVGVCCGAEADDAVVLQSIGVLYEHWRQGIGSRLLRDFEDAVFNSSRVTGISLGSADDVPTEAFYMKNGYGVRSIMLTVPGSAPEPAPGAPQPSRVRNDGDNRVLYFEVDEYDRLLRESLVASHAASQGLFIFEKPNPAPA